MARHGSPMGVPLAGVLLLLGGVLGLGGGQGWDQGWPREGRRIQGAGQGLQRAVQGLAAYKRVDTQYSVPGLELLDSIAQRRGVRPTEERIPSSRRNPTSSRRASPSPRRAPPSPRRASPAPRRAPSSPHRPSPSPPRFPRPAFHSLPRFPSSFPGETGPGAQGFSPISPAFMQPAPRDLGPGQAFPNSFPSSPSTFPSSFPSSPSSFPSSPSSFPPSPSSFPNSPSSFPSSPFHRQPEGGRPDSPHRGFTGLFDPFRNFFPSSHNQRFPSFLALPPSGPSSPFQEVGRQSEPVPSTTTPATTPATTAPWRKKSPRKKNSASKKKFWVVTTKAPATTTTTTTQRPTTTTQRPTTTATTTQRPTTTATTTQRPKKRFWVVTTKAPVTTRQPIRLPEFSRDVFEQQQSVHEYEYDNTLASDYPDYQDHHSPDYTRQDEDARPDYSDYSDYSEDYSEYPDYTPVPSSCPDSLSACVDSCAPVLAIQQRAYKLCVNECLERCT